MSEMIEVKTADLIGAALDWAVAQADGWTASIIVPVITPSKTYYEIRSPSGLVLRPSTEWGQGGPLIEKHAITLLPPRYLGDKWGATYCVDSCMLDGTSPLIAACRAIVAAKLGDAVSVPAELL